MNELTGKIAEACFENGFRFKLEYLDGEKMRYTSLDDASLTEVVKIFVCKVADGKFSVNWLEGNGTSVNHIIDINSGTVRAFITRTTGTRKIFTLTGTFKLINDETFTAAQKILAYLHAVFNEKNLSVAEKFWAGTVWKFCASSSRKPIRI